jgi:hypothetical protein
METKHVMTSSQAVTIVPLCILLSCFATARSTVAQDSEVPADELARRVTADELKAEQQDQSHWSFRLEIQNANGQKEVDQVIETRNGDLKRPLLINGRELTAEQQQKSERQTDQLVRNPGALRQSLNNKNEDAARSQRLLKMLPDAFHFIYGERRGDLVQLNFSPKPNFHPPTREAEVFHAMEGSVWVSTKQSRVEEIAGHLIHEVKFGGGLLGHLNKGGTFDVKQAEVGPGYWELTLLRVQMKGRAFFFKTISVQQNYSRSDFRQVPDNLTLAQAADILRKQSTPTKKPASTARRNRADGNVRCFRQKESPPRL